jgi:hypothetical protein
MVPCGAAAARTLCLRTTSLMSGSTPRDVWDRRSANGSFGAYETSERRPAFMSVDQSPALVNDGTPTMRTLLRILPVLLTAGCVSTGFSEPAPPPPAAMLAGHQPRAHVSVREERGEIELVAGPFHVPATEGGLGHGHHDEDASMKGPLVVVPWPVDGGLTGFRMAAYGTDGSPLPRELLHHVIGVNFSRRQLVHPVAERIFGFGTETPDIKLPGFLEVPLEQGDSVGVYAMWNNTTGRDLEGVYLQVILPYAADGRAREQALPFYVDTNNRIGQKTSFDLPPGRSERSFEFELPVGGGLLAAGGHLHEHGVELRLEEAESGRVLVTLRPEVERGGRVTAVEQKIFRRFFKLIDARLRLESGMRYRVVGVYDNPTGRAIPDGGMAHIVGPFVPDDLAAWPPLDRAGPEYEADRAALPRPIEDAHVHR